MCDLLVVKSAPLSANFSTAKVTAAFSTIGRGLLDTYSHKVYLRPAPLRCGLPSFPSLPTKTTKEKKCHHTTKGFNAQRRIRTAVNTDRCIEEPQRIILTN
ncbi:hypothetical protein CORC01_01095 [Colletotrichum orchidophilum]|uniref:Uncharacterized protein n=1 Tax=Colletotrichum orchidophilum TaxID=1209926 RepID=A0A1G4BR58_9PEZI|nr:uncharacterized protein CORC01_01095 [Colletotrichum orchidophilum]OHF03776.1 hypothetical protein CORC01_01095 [Colletotrichum orchidophilum]